MAPETVVDFSAVARAATLRISVIRSGAGDQPRVLALHGGGQSTRNGILYLLSDLARQAVSSVSFDFSGHGESTGRVDGSSLSERADQAIAVVEQAQLQRPISLIATSMGGHIACTLISRLSPPALVLFCPAAYAAAAQEATFGPRFQSVLRSTVDYAGSPAFSALEQFEGKLLLVYGTSDSVIPAEVFEQYERRATRAKQVEVVRLPGVGHRVHDWLRSHPEEYKNVLDSVLQTLPE